MTDPGKLLMRNTDSLSKNLSLFSYDKKNFNVDCNMVRSDVTGSESHGRVTRSVVESYMYPNLPDVLETPELGNDDPLIPKVDRMEILPAKNRIQMNSIEIEDDLVNFHLIEIDKNGKISLDSLNKATLE